MAVKTCLLVFKFNVAMCSRSTHCLGTCKYNENIVRMYNGTVGHERTIICIKHFKTVCLIIFIIITVGITIRKVFMSYKLVPNEINLKPRTFASKACFSRFVTILKQVFIGFSILFNTR